MKRFLLAVATFVVLPFCAAEVSALEEEFGDRPRTLAKSSADGRPEAVGTPPALLPDAAAVGTPNAGGQDVPGFGSRATISGSRRVYDSPRRGASVRADWLTHRTA